MLRCKRNLSALRSKSASQEFTTSPPSPTHTPSLHVRLLLLPSSRLLPKEIPLVVRGYSWTPRLT